MLSRDLARFEEGIYSNRHQQDLYLGVGNCNRSTRGPQEDLLKRDPADSLAGSGLRAQLRLEQRPLRSQDGSGL
jgi:hypothetical protein